MTPLTVEHTEAADGYTLIRSDGVRFLLRWGEHGNAVLYLVQHGDKTPLSGLVDFDISITDKLENARRWAVAYPQAPTLDT